MFEDFSFCTECDYYDRNDRLCKLYQCVRVNGCQCGVERKPRNRFEMVKAMSMEEMAVFFTSTIWLAAMLGVNPFDGTGNNYNKWLEWLKEAIADG